MGVSRDCPISFGYPLLSQEQVKLRTSNFVATFTGSIGTKAHENVGNDGRGRISPENFQGTHMYRGHLCDSTAFLLYCTMQPLSGSSSTLKRMTLNDLEWSFCVKIWSELGIQWAGSGFRRKLFGNLQSYAYNCQRNKNVAQRLYW